MNTFVVPLAILAALASLRSEPIQPNTETVKIEHATA